MRKAAIALVVVLVLSSFGAGIASASYHNQGQGGQDDQNASTNDSQDRQQNGTGDQDGSSDGERGPPDSAKQRREKARQMAQRAGLFARFTYQDGHAEGKFLSFNLSEDTATVSEYTLTHNGTATAFFSEIAPANFTREDPARVAGSQLMLRGEGLHLQAHNNPTGLLRYTATKDAGSTVTFRLADDASAGQVVNESLINVKAGDRTGQIILAGNGTLTAAAGQVTAQLAGSGSILFKAIPLGGSPAEAKQARALSQATAKGKLGASMRLAGVNGTPAAEAANFTVNASAREATEGRARVEVTSNESQGKVVNLAIARSTLNASAPDDVTVQFDGAPVTPEATIDEVVNATGDTPRAHVLVTNSTVEVTVYVPGFSTHSLITKDADLDLPDLPTPPRVDNPSGAAASVAAQARQQVDRRANAWDQLPSQARSQASQQARQVGLFSAFDLSGGVASGGFVSLGVDGSAGSFSDVSVQAGGSSAPFFEQVSLDPYTQAASPTNAGPTVALIGDQVTALVHDTPTGALNVKAGSQSVTVTYRLADDVSMDRLGDDHVKLTADGVHGHVILASGNGELALEGSQLRLALGANAQGLFLVHPPGDTVLAQALHERIEAIKQGTYGAEASIAAAADGQAVDAVQSYSVDAQTQAVQAGSQVTTTLSSQAPSPRVVQLTLPADLVGTSDVGDVEVQIDGQPVGTARSAQALLEDAGSATAKAHVSAQGGALQVLVNVAGFSEKDVTVQSTDTDGGGDDTNDTTDGTDGDTQDGQQGTPAPGVVGIAAVLATAAALVRVRRER